MQVLTTETCPLSVAPYPWSLKQGEKWTPKARADQLRHLKKAPPLERVALPK